MAAEEDPPAAKEGGAPLVIQEGGVDNPKVDAIVGPHINTQTEIGKIKYKSGTAMASSNWFTLVVKVKQSHGSAPWSGLEFIVPGAQIIQAFETIISRQEDLTKAPVLITVGKINGGMRNIILPKEITMEEPIRTLDTKIGQGVQQRMQRTAKYIAEASGAMTILTIHIKTRVSHNPVLVKNMLPLLEVAAGEGECGRNELGYRLRRLFLF